MIAGLGLALGSALSTNVAFLFEQRGAVLAPPVLARHLLRSAVGLFRSRWFSLGSAVAVAAWGLHVGALALAPRRQWAGVIITAFGLAMICDHGRAARQCGASLLAGGADRRGVRRLCARCRADRDLDARQRRLCRGGTAAWCCGRGAVRSVRRRAEVPHRSFTGGLHGIVSEWTLAALAASLGFYASARGLQLGPGVAVIAFTSVAANLAAIMGGILVFRDPIAIGALAIVGRVIAFGLVIVGAALMPAPLRASEASGRSF